jgi:hypothetical protein
MKTLPTSHALDLGAAIDAKMPAGAIQRMALAYQDLGLWSPNMPIDDDGKTLAQVWLLAMTKSSGPDLDEATGKWLLSLQPLDELWKSKAYYDRSLGEALVRAFSDQNSRKDFLLSRYLWEALPTKALERLEWHASVERSNIMAFAVARDRADLVELLLERGWDWNYRSGGTIAKTMTSPQMWETFLNSGGDPRQMITHGDPGPEQFRGPLWQYLGQIAGAYSPEAQALKETALEYGRAVAPSLLGAQEIKAYWGGINKAYGLQPVESAVVARKDWDQLINDQGQNTLMVAFGKHNGVVKKFAAKKKGLPLFPHVDNRGWSMFHYLMDTQSRDGLPLSDWTEVLKLSPKQPDPQHGLITALMLDNPNKFNQNAFNYPDGLFKRPDAPTPEEVWGGSPENQDAAARVLLGDHAYFGRITENLGRLLKDCPPPPSATPLLRGAVAAHALLKTSYGRCAPRALVEEIIQGGAAVEMSPTCREKYQKECNNGSFIMDAIGQMESHFRAIQLDSSLPAPVKGPRSGPRF